MNQLRGLLLEYGIALPKGRQSLEKHLPEILAQDNKEMSELTKSLSRDLLKELKEVKEKLAEYDRKIESIYRAHPICQRLGSIPGVGPLTATAIIATIGSPESFENGRQLAAYFGLVPRQYSTGGKDRLLGISKRGDVYIRKLLIHGARTVIQWVKDKTDPRSLWLKKLIERRGMNRATVALANKNARVIWVLMSRDEKYQEDRKAA